MAEPILNSLSLYAVGIKKDLALLAASVTLIDLVAHRPPILLLEVFAKAPFL